MKTVAILGLGNRGSVYADGMSKNAKVKIVAVCDILSESLCQAKEKYGVDESGLFLDEEEFFKEKRADILVIATLDQLHYRQTMRALALGYDVLLEKPVTPAYEECKAIAEYAQQQGRKVVVCHNLRYTPFYQTLKQMVADGKIGDVVSFEQSENVGFPHYMCSFIRGKWHRQALTSPIILQKCCHDLDIIYWIIGKKCETLSSYGALGYYNEQHAPADSTAHCFECPRKDCPYNATMFYVRAHESLCVPYGFDYSDENILRYLSDKDNDYGKCVFHLDNDVCDRQTVNMQFEGGVTANLIMHGFANETHRITKIYGTKGYLEGRLEHGIITWQLYGKRKRKIDVNKLILNGEGHSGGDSKLVEDFVDYMVDGKQALGISFVSDSVYSHKLAFTAEESRLQNGKTIRIGREL